MRGNLQRKKKDNVALFLPKGASLEFSRRRTTSYYNYPRRKKSSFSFSKVIIILLLLTALYFVATNKEPISFPQIRFSLPSIDWRSFFPGAKEPEPVMQIPFEFALVPRATPVPGRETIPSLVYRIKKGDSVASMINQLGFPSVIADELSRGLTEMAEKDSVSERLSIGQEFRFALALDGTPKRIVTSDVATRQIVFTKKKDGTYKASVNNLPTNERERVVAGRVMTTFAQAALDSGIDYSLVDDFVDLFSDRVSFHKDLKVGDRFTIIYRQDYLEDGTALPPGAILAAALDVNGAKLVAARYIGTDGKARYFNEKGETSGKGFLRYPLKFSRVSSYFSHARFHPVLKRKVPHNGVDFAAPTGTPVRTVADGKVTFAGWKGANGMMVKIQHGPRYATAYVHLSRISKGVKKGATVRRGQEIGGVGATGRATGPHLHYSFYDNGKYVDPLKIKLPTIDSLDPGAKIPPNYLRRVLFTMQHFQSAEIDSLYQPKPSFW